VEARTILIFTIIAFISFTCQSSYVKEERSNNLIVFERIDKTGWEDYAMTTTLIIDYTKRSIQVLEGDSLVNQLALTPEIVEQLNRPFEDIDESSENRIYNVNSSDVVEYSLTVYYNNSDYAYSIRSFGLGHELPKNSSILFQELLKLLIKTAKS
jgi:hypothetical protein